MSEPTVSSRLTISSGLRSWSRLRQLRANDGARSGSDVAYVPLNDAAYGYLQKQFHAADIALHAAQADTAVVVASTNGPTMIVNSNGVVTRSLDTSDAGHIRN